MRRFGGAFTALITPFTDDCGSVDSARLREHVLFQAAGGVAGVVPCGTTGEAPTLTDEEYRAVVEQVTEVGAEAGLRVIAGTGSNDTRHAIALHRLAASSGCDGSLQVTPYYNKPSQEGLYRHFMAVADAADLPIVLYNIPGRTGVALAAATIRRLADHPNIVAIKEASGSLELAAEIIGTTDLDVLSGDDPLTLPLIAIGGRGVISVVSNILPQRVAALCEAALAGDLEGARAIHLGLLPLAHDLLHLDGNPVGVKTAMHLLGRDGGALRPPLCRPPERVVAALQSRVEAVRQLAAVTA